MTRLWQAIKTGARWYYTSVVIAALCAVSYCAGIWTATQMAIHMIGAAR